MTQWLKVTPSKLVVAERKMSQLRQLTITNALWYRTFKLVITEIKISQTRQLTNALWCWYWTFKLVFTEIKMSCLIQLRQAKRLLRDDKGKVASPVKLIDNDKASLDFDYKDIKKLLRSSLSSRD